MRKYFDPQLREIYQFWIDQIKIEFPTSKYKDFTVADFFEEFQNSKDLDRFYPDLYLALDHYSFLPTRKEIKKQQDYKWRLMLRAVSSLP